eukprot:Plantae.Rhodophyta-Rhodochaete_pulchella.ctg1256.p1 GENE.Plantae.Rhodophyta-Rhodochaete_pulchella.ctg1256~~Plantae.Rhodophyta-Rhodochaete_pulchella.ctg1256.p1  ORF type:complete len:299 (-),score=46.55 Plantae.Rhodophyta-Rhodochaete_pulchella.ctg1256:869-1765(-)
MAAGLQNRFQRSIEEGNYYDAEQACRTIYHRLSKSGKSDEALQALVHGALKMLGAKQVTSGTALGLLVTKHMMDPATAKPFSPEPYILVESISSAFPLHGSSDQETVEWTREHLQFVRSAIKWTKASGGPVNGDERMNAQAGKLCFRLNDYAGSQKHYLTSNDPEGHAEMVLAWAETEGVRSEVDLFVMRTIFKYLVVGNLNDANVLLSAFLQKYGKGFSPLSNFAEMLLMTLERENAHPLFAKLQEVYAPSLNRDPTFMSYMSKVAAVFYNIQPPPSGGLLGGLMGEMMRGFSAPTR